jgi:DNA-binding response OmpR family regulator
MFSRTGAGPLAAFGQRTCEVRAWSRRDGKVTNGSRVPVQQTSDRSGAEPGPGVTATVAKSSTRVLIVEDEQDIATLIQHTLEKLGNIEVEIVTSGDAALRAVMDRTPDLILLDLNLPVLSGLEVCRILRGRPNTAHVPIIMVTARTTESDRVTGLDVGADDYITKPFSLRELAARVRAVLRRTTGDAAAGASPLVYRGKHLLADFDAVSVSVDGQAVRLTRREFELLRYLVENRNRVLSRDRLLERVWGYERYVETRSVDVHVGRLRGKLGNAGRQIETVVGLGYRFVE